MQSPFSYGGMYDEFLTAEVRGLQKTNRRISRHGLISALRQAKGMSLRDADRAVEDYCQRGVLQALLGDKPFDTWLTQQIESAYSNNRGITATALAKRLCKEHSEELISAESASMPQFAQWGVGLADAVDVVNEYFARHALIPVLGPFPLAGVIVVSCFELLLILPVAWILHMAALSFGSPLTPHQRTLYVSAFLCGIAGENVFRNWRRTRSKKRWSSYEAVRERLLESSSLSRLS